MFVARLGGSGEGIEEVGLTRNLAALMKRGIHITYVAIAFIWISLTPEISCRGSLRHVA